MKNLVADEQYCSVLKQILEEGWMAPNRTEYNAQKLIQKTMYFDLGKGELPLLKTKHVAWKTAIKEMLWIYQKASNKVQDFRDMFTNGSTIWDGWEGEDGTIGKAYGYQIATFHQVENLIKTLKTNPQDRSMMLNLWNWQDKSEMNINPCCFLTMWDVTQGKLNCTLIQRSCDMGLGVPLNMIQFAALQIAIAWAVGLKPGTLCHFLQNAHVYENQLDSIKKQLNNYNELLDFSPTSDSYLAVIVNSIPTLHMRGEYLPYEEITVDQALERFYSIEPEDFILEDYHHFNAINMGEVAGAMK